MALLTDLCVSGLLLTISHPLLLGQQCQVVLTSEDVIRSEVRSVLENLTDQINSFNDKLDRLHVLGSENYPALSCASLLQHNPATPGFHTGFFEKGGNHLTPPTYQETVPITNALTARIRLWKKF